MFEAASEWPWPWPWPGIFCWPRPARSRARQIIPEKKQGNHSKNTRKPLRLSTVETRLSTVEIRLSTVEIRLSTVGNFKYLRRLGGVPCQSLSLRLLLVEYVQETAANTDRVEALHSELAVTSNKCRPKIHRIYHTCQTATQSESEHYICCSY